MKSNSSSPNRSVCIVSLDERFARMLMLALEDKGIRVSVSKSVPKRNCLLIIDIDTVKPGSAKNALTISCKEEEAPAFLRPFNVELFAENIKSKVESDRDDSGETLVLYADSVSYNGVAVELSELEYKLFKLLYENRGKTITLEKIKEIVWNGEDKGNSAIVYINYLRKKLDFRFGKRFIVTVRGKGYLLAPDRE